MFYQKMFTRIFIVLQLLFIILCSEAQKFSEVKAKIVNSGDIRVGAERTELYFPLLKGKNVALVANQTSNIKKIHLVDTLLKAGINVKKIFCPEHGFRGEAEAGEEFNSNKDAKTGLPLISLYGKNKKPDKAELKDIDIIIYDIQDVGVRFYTYISTLHYIMESCAENKITLLILDRPNPNGFYVDGPVLENDCRSFVGIDPVPIVYGMTEAEYARMVNEEGWLGNGLKCELKYVTIDKYNHSDYYQLPVKPSPNLPNMEAVYLYPTLGLFEGTIISVGRGTQMPFQVIGHPDLKDTVFSFTPIGIKGMSLDPPYKGIKCFGYNLKNYSEDYIKNLKELYLFWLIESYKELIYKGNYFNNFFDKLAGTHKLKEQITNGFTEEEIHNTWSDDLAKFKMIRRKYLLYPDFE